MQTSNNLSCNTSEAKNLLCSYAAGMPKCELHLHIEGTLEPELFMKLAQKHNVKTPYNSAKEVEQAFEFDNLQSFLDIYGFATKVLIDEADFYELTMQYLKRAHSDNIIHAEIMFDPQLHTERGIDFLTVIEGIRKAQEIAYKEMGITSKLINCFHRNLPMEKHWETFTMVEKHLDKIDGIGLDNTERGYPCYVFEGLYKKAKSLGLHCIAHAGEEGPAWNVKDAIDILGVERVDHGVNSTEDPKLIHKLIEKEIPLTVCPISNYRLQVISSIEFHPLLKNSEMGPNGSELETIPQASTGSSNAPQILDLIHHGLKICINSDDPSYFKGYLNDNFIACIQTGKGLNWDYKTVRKLVENSIAGSFLITERKTYIMNLVKSYHDNFMKKNKLIL